MTTSSPGVNWWIKSFSLACASSMVIVVGMVWPPSVSFSSPFAPPRVPLGSAEPVSASEQATPGISPIARVLLVEQALQQLSFPVAVEQDLAERPGHRGALAAD